MPPKSASKGKGKGDKKGAAKAEPVEDPAEAQFKKLVKAYKGKCTELGLQEADHASVNAIFKKVLTAEDPQYPRSFIFSQPVNPVACQALCASLETNRYERLKTLSFWNCDLGDVAGKAVAQVLRHVTSLNKLEMIDCQLSKATCDALGYELGRSGSYHISILKLDNNRFGAEGAKLLCAGLAKHSTLRTLSMACCEVGAVGAVAVAEMVKAKGSQLKTLNLEGNDLGNIGAQTLAAGIESNNSLTDVNIAFNHIGTSPPAVSLAPDSIEVKQPSGVSTMNAIVKALSQCKSLGQLNMTGNLLSDEEAEVLVNAIETPALSHVYGLKVSGAVKKELIERLIKASLEHKPAPVKSGKKKGGKKKKKK